MQNQLIQLHLDEHALDAIERLKLVFHVQQTEQVILLALNEFNAHEVLLKQSQLEVQLRKKHIKELEDRFDPERKRKR